MTQGDIERIKNEFIVINYDFILLFRLINDIELNRDSEMDVDRKHESDKCFELLTIGIERFKEKIDILRNNPILEVGEFEFDFTKFFDCIDEFFDEFIRDSYTLTESKRDQFKNNITKGLERMNEEIISMKSRIGLAKIQSPFIKIMNEMINCFENFYNIIKYGINPIKNIEQNISSKEPQRNLTVTTNQKPDFPITTDDKRTNENLIQKRIKERINKKRENPGL